MASFRPLFVDAGGIRQMAVGDVLLLDGNLDVQSYVITTSVADGSIVIAPNGIGALRASDTGNARGRYAVDWQIVRGLDTQVASGDYSAIVGGTYNVASGVYGTAAGYSNTASGDYSIAAQCVCMASGVAGFASGYYAVADHYGQFARAAGRFAAAGDAQMSISVARISTTDGTTATLYLDGASLKLTLVDQDCWYFSVTLVARRQDAEGEGAAWKFEGVIDRNGSTTALVGDVLKTIVYKDVDAWDANVAADDANDSLAIQVTGEAGKTIRWAAAIFLTEVNG